MTTICTALRLLTVVLASKQPPIARLAMYDNSTQERHHDNFYASAVRYNVDSSLLQNHTVLGRKLDHTHLFQTFFDFNFQLNLKLYSETSSRLI